MLSHGKKPFFKCYCKNKDCNHWCDTGRHPEHTEKSVRNKTKSNKIVIIRIFILSCNVFAFYMIYKMFLLFIWSIWFIVYLCKQTNKPLSVRNVIFIIKQNEQLYDNKRGRKPNLCIDKY